MKKRTKITLIILAILIVGISAVVWWQYGNIKAIYYGLKYSSEDIDSRMAHTHDDVKKYLESNPQYKVRPTEPVEEELHKEEMLTDSELTDIIMGETSVEEVFGTQIELNEEKKLTITETGQLLDKDSAEKLKAEAKTEDKNENLEKDSKVDNSQKISEYVAQLYVLKSNFVSRLEGLYNQAISDYKAMTPEQRKANGKTVIANKYYSSAASMEAECDSKVSSILSELKTLLSEQGSDMTLVDRIKMSYYEEKSLKKAYYVNKLK